MLFRSLDSQHIKHRRLCSRSSLSINDILDNFYHRRVVFHAFKHTGKKEYWRACVLAGLTEIQCIVRTMDDYESMTVALIENLQREDLNPMEEARACGQIRDHLGITQEELADRIGKSRPAVANCLRLLKLPEKAQTLLEKGVLSAGHGRALPQ